MRGNFGTYSTGDKFRVEVEGGVVKYYASTQGRFTSPDEFTGGPKELYYFVDDASANPTFYADLTNPQSLNKYQYAYGNPVRFVDPDGHDPEPDPDPQDPCGCASVQKQGNDLRDSVRKVDEATSKPLFPITDAIGTSTPPPLGPIALPNDPTRVEPNTQSWPQGWPKSRAEPAPKVEPKLMPRPVDKPNPCSHPNKKGKKNWDKDTKPRPGDKKPPNYRWDRRPKPKPKPTPEPPKPKPTPKPEIGPDGEPVKPPREV